MKGFVFDNMLQGITNIAAQNNYRLVICSNTNSDNEFFYVDYFEDNTVDGIIFISPHEEFGSVDEFVHINRMKEENIPFVFVNGHTNVQNVKYVNVDFYGSTYLATNYLIEKGYKDITYITPQLLYYELKERYHGYENAMKEKGLVPNICDVEDIQRNIQNFKAVVTNKSNTAYKVIKEAASRNLSIPNEFVLIAGNTEEYSEYLIPSLSSVVVPAKEMGETATQALIDTMKGQKISTNLQPKCRLVIRETC